MPTRDRWRLASAWGPVLVWAGVIWVLGGDRWSAPQTSRILGPLIDWLLPSLDALRRDEIVHAIRKLAHPGVYGLLALLGLRALAWSTPWRRLGVAATTLGGVAALAIADETRQAGSGVRTGAAGDVLLDVGGAALIVVLSVAIERLLGRRLFASGRASEAEARSTPAGL